MPKTSPTVFISYSWDDDAHKEWVKTLADHLLDSRIKVLLDQYDATAGTDFIYFMEQAVSKADYIVMVLTPNYKEKSDKRSKGVGYEQVLTSREFYDREIEDRFIIPILRKGSSEESTPRYLRSIVNLDFKEDGNFETELEKLLKRLYDFSDKPDHTKGKLPDFLIGKRQVKANSSKHLNTKKVRYDLSSEEVLGRESELQKLLELLQTSKSLVLVSGLGGIGKTTLVNYYLSQYQQNYAHIGWVSCTGDFKNDLLASLDNDALLGKDESTDLEVRFHNRLLGLQQLPGKNLLILDNINTPEEAQEILQYKDRFPNHVQFLMTARVNLQGYPTHQIGVLEEADAVALFRKHYTFKKGDTETQLQAILQHIGRHTLVIEMLAKGMNLSGRLNLARMIERIQAKGIQSIEVEATTERAGGQNKRLNDFVAEVLNLSFKDIADENWLLLQQLAVLPPVTHKFEFLTHLLGRDEEATKEELDAQLSRLQQRGLLEYIEDGVRLHPVLREVILEKKSLEYGYLETLVARLADTLYYDAQDKTHLLADRQPLMIYGDVVVEQVQFLEKEEVSELLDNLGGVYEEFGQYQTTAQLKKRALSIAEVIFESNHTTVNVRKNNLALVYKDLGRYEEAAEMASSALEIDIHNFGESHPQVAIKANNLAWVELSTNKYTVAATHFEQAYVIFKEQLGEVHHHTKEGLEYWRNALQKGAEAEDEYCREILARMEE